MLRLLLARTNAGSGSGAQMAIDAAMTARQWDVPVHGSLSPGAPNIGIEDIGIAIIEAASSNGAPTLQH